MKKSVVVIGGGLAGTAAAHTLVGRGYSVTIIEKNGYLGGRIHSELVNETAVEMGAGFMTSAYSNVRAFLAATGLDSHLYRQRSSSGIFHGNHISMVSFDTSFSNKPLSWGSKLYTLLLLAKTLVAWPQLDLHAFWKASKYDYRSVAAMFSSQSGEAFVEYALQPVLNGYFYWTPELTSEAMLLILCKAAFSHRTYKMRGGLQRIPEKAAEGSVVLLNHTVEKIGLNKSGSYTLVLSSQRKQRTIIADAIVCTTTASVVPTIFSSLTERQKKFFGAVRYSSGALMARTYHLAQTRGGSTAIAFPRREGISLSSITLSPEPDPQPRHPLATLKTYASGEAGNRYCAMPDDLLAQTLTEAMRPVSQAVLIGNPKPMARHLQRWPEALPLFDVGHFRRLRMFENGEIENDSQPIVFAGDYIGGPFMEGAFTSGVRAAERLDERICKCSQVHANPL